MQSLIPTTIQQTKARSARTDDLSAVQSNEAQDSCPPNTLTVQAPFLFSDISPLTGLRRANFVFEFLRFVWLSIQQLECVYGREAYTRGTRDPVPSFVGRSTKGSNL
jgi:hypothetical protein